MNDAPTRGHEVDVGSRTTLRLLYPESSTSTSSTSSSTTSSEGQRGEGSLVVVLPFKTADLQWLHEMLGRGLWRRAARSWHVTPSHVRLLHPHFALTAARDLLLMPVAVTRAGSAPAAWTKVGNFF
ncbi:unnamed protein product [Lampetra fluviatilis]